MYKMGKITYVFDNKLQKGRARVEFVVEDGILKLVFWGKSAFALKSQ